MNLAEIIAEGKRLEAECREAQGVRQAIYAGDSANLFYVIHGPRLLAVAEAGMAIREEYVGIEDGLPWLMRQKLAAFDAAASGEGRG